MSVIKDGEIRSWGNHSTCLEKVVSGLKPRSWTAYVWAVGTSLGCFSSSCLLSRIVLNALFSHPSHHTNSCSSPSSDRESLDDDLTGERVEYPPRSQATLKALSSLTLITNLSKKVEALAMGVLGVFRAAD